MLLNGTLCREYMYVCHKTLWRVRRCGLIRAFVLSFVYKVELNFMSNWLGFLHVWKVVWHEVVDFEPVLRHHIWSEKGAYDWDLSWNMNQLCGKETSIGHLQASSTSNLRCKTICMLMLKDGRNFWMFWVLKHQTSLYQRNWQSRWWDENKTCWVRQFRLLKSHQCLLPERFLTVPAIS
jgi:hypothetical protein